MNLDALELAAKAATQGTWWHRAKPGRQGFVQADDVPGVKMPYGLELLCDDYTGFGGDKQREMDVAFVAAANPAVVLELIRRLREAESKSAVPREESAPKDPKPDCMLCSGTGLTSPATRCICTY